MEGDWIGQKYNIWQGSHKKKWIVQ